MQKRSVVAAITGVAIFATAAFASYPSFVAKNDVQAAFSWNNKQLQENASAVKFAVESVDVTTWECLNTKNEKIQERQRTTTKSGVVTTTTRDTSKGKNGAVTGFTLGAYDGSVTTTSEGPALYSCPSGQTFLEDSVETTPGEGSVLMVSKDQGVSFQALYE